MSILRHAGFGLLKGPSHRYSFFKEFQLNSILKNILYYFRPNSVQFNFKDFFYIIIRPSGAGANLYVYKRKNIVCKTGLANTPTISPSEPVI